MADVMEIREQQALVQAVASWMWEHTHSAPHAIELLTAMEATGVRLSRVLPAPTATEG